VGDRKIEVETELAKLLAHAADERRLSGPGGVWTFAISNPRTYLPC
jgi:hypothetical protein